MSPMARAEFDALVEDVARTLPERYRRYLENVAIVVAVAPSERQRRVARLRSGSLLLGLYEGVPRVARYGHPTEVPDTITLFQVALESVCATRDELRTQIRATLIHEIGHHLGLDERRVRRAASRRR